jgi:acetolactate synthase I/II/III large subunit
MKISDYIADFLAQNKIAHVYVVQGGAVAHLIDSVAKHPTLEYVCMQHEQASAMAADAQSRITGNLGAAMATSGPGATNLITGICSAYYDSVPVIYVTGQVSTFRNKGNTGVRQIGFQETEIVSMVKSITNYTVCISDPKRIRYELEKAFYLAQKGRPGPVLIDIPDNTQRELIDPETLDSFIPPASTNNPVDNKQIDRCLKMVQSCKRPVIIFGAGIYLSGAEKEAKTLLNTLGFPMVPTWATADFLPSNHHLAVGTFGTHGTRYANYTVQNADLIFSIGSRLDTKATGTPITNFARGAKKIVVDIDVNELNKFSTFGLELDESIHCDAKTFLTALNEKVSKFKIPEISEWLSTIANWKEKYPICPSKYCEEKEVNPYVFVKSLSQECVPNESIIIDTGCCVAWMMQAFEFKENQRLFHDWNNTAMGWATPASIGAAFEKKGQRIICVMGDGSLKMNIQEWSTIIKHNLPIKIFILNNHGYSMIQQTQDQWLDSMYEASSEQGGLPSPNFLEIAKAYGFRTVNISQNQGMDILIRETLSGNDPVVCNIEILPSHRVIPQAKFGYPNEDQEPLMDRKEFLSNMIVNPLPVSRLRI